MRKILFLTTLFLTISIAISAWAQEEVLSFEGEHAPLWRLKAKSPLLIGGYGNNFAYDGKNVVPYEGGAEALVDATQNTGTMTATFTGTINPEKDKTYTGEIKIVYNVTPTDGPDFWEGGVADFIYLHGDTKQGAPVMPRTRTFLSSWAAADVYVNDELIYKGLDGHMMLTERSRDVTTHAIYADSTRTSFYSPMEPTRGFIVAPDEKELHFVVHSTTPDENNFPPHTVWIHLNFQDVTDLSPAEEFSNVFFMSLESGLNMISLPLKPVETYTARSLAEYLGATVVIKLDEKRSRFVGFTMDAPNNGFKIEGGKGYIVNVKEGRTVAFVGAAWTNQPPVEAAPPTTVRNSAWAFVVTGKLSDKARRLSSYGDEGHESRYIVIVKNHRTGAVASDAVNSDTKRFAAVWANLNRRSVVESGDLLEITVVDAISNRSVGSIKQKVTPTDITNAFISLRINLSDILPAKSALAQNYPNPFNPETWIPYQLAQDADVVLKIYDVSGKLVRRLELGHKTAGYYLSKDSAAHWDGKNNAGEPVVSGTYLYYLKAGDFTATRKLVILK